MPNTEEQMDDRATKTLTKAQQARLEKITLLRASRTSARNAASRKIAAIDALLKDSSTTADDLEDELTILQQREEELIDLDGKIESLIDNEAELVAERDDAIAERERITLYKSKTTRAIRKANGQSGSSYGESTVIAGNNGNSAIKLQPIPIIKFSGDHTKWPSFWSRFKITVDDNPRLSKVEKMIHLISYLEGEASQAVQGFPELDSSYDEIVELLKRRYDKSLVAINEHIRKLLYLQPVLDPNDLKALRRLLDTCEVSLRCLKSLGVKTAAEKASYVCTALMRCLPLDIRTAYLIKNKPGNNTEWDADELIGFFREQVECREMAELLGGKQGTTKIFNCNPNKKQYENPKFKSKTESKNEGSASALSVQAKKQTTDNSYCIFCQATGHKTTECPNFTLEQKKQAIKDNGRCSNCLKFGHSAENCFSKFKSCKVCQQKTHNWAVCDQNKSHLKNSEITNLGGATSVVSSVNGGTKIVLLQTAMATVRNPSFPQKQGVARALLDGGSQISFVREDLSRKLELPIICRENLDVYSFGDETPSKRKPNRVKLTLENRADPNQKVEIEAIEVPFICHAVPSINSLEIQSFMNQKGLQLADESEENQSNSELQILIGGDSYWRVVSGKNERFSEDIVAIETVLGWSIQGPTEISQSKYAACAVSSMLISVGQRQINDSLTKFWELESMGIKEKMTEDPIVDATVDRFLEDIKFTGERYSVKFPWIVSKETLPDNFPTAEKRLRGLIKKFKRDPKYFSDYKKVIEDQVESGVVEVVPYENLKNQSAGTYYVPHQGVVRENVATTKLRVVFDASSHSTGTPSLNECLSPGPNLNPDLLVLLLKFRKHAVVVVSDIEKAFLQVALDEADRDSVRFLWVKERNGEIIENEFSVLRSTRVPFGVSSSPFLLSCAIKYHLQNSEGADQNVVEKLNNELYVDDFLSGGKDVNDAYDISVGAARLLKGAGMKLRKWVTNSPKLRERWNNHSVPGELELFEKLDVENETKILGLNYDPNSDQFSFDLNKLITASSGLKRTKRHVLSFVSQIFDPIGLLAPFTIRAKILFQNLWKVEKLDWDSELPEETGNQFEAWCEELGALQKIKIKRHYFSHTKDVTRLELHCFCDASTKAFATAIYIRYETRSNQIGVALITAKSRVAPLKEKGLTLPRLELMGCLLGARLTNYVKGTFGEELNDIFFWTDSTIALSWVTDSPKTWKPFVSNRASEIQSLTKANEWAHCPGIDNPADLPTRGIKASSLANSELWWTGPKWLGKTKVNWPKITPMPNLDSVANERRKLVMAVNVVETVGVQKIVDLTRSNSLDKILRVTAYVRRFVKAAQKLGKTTGPITADELKYAELKFVKDIQAEEYRSELKALGKGEKVNPSSSIASLSPILNEEGIICLGGRLGESEDLTYNEKHPFILNKRFRFSKLLMLRSHNQVSHGGIGDTITQLRERYWLTAGRQLARTIVKDCLKCKKFNAKLGEVPTAPLPKDRISENPAFSIIGVDFFGPLIIRNQNINSKAYVLLATCAVTRAVHLELVSSLCTRDFLLAFRRMITRRGLPSIMYSVNALTFKRADKEIRKIWETLNDAELKDFFGHHGIKWKYIVERSAWYGGWWERLVRSAKTSLKKILGKAFLNYSEIETILSETEAIINSRPISYIYNDPN